MGVRLEGCQAHTERWRFVQREMTMSDCTVHLRDRRDAVYAQEETSDMGESTAAYRQNLRWWKTLTRPRCLIPFRSYPTQSMWGARSHTSPPPNVPFIDEITGQEVKTSHRQKRGKWSIQMTVRHKRLIKNED